MSIARHQTFVKPVFVVVCIDCDDELFDGAHFERKADADAESVAHADESQGVSREGVTTADAEKRPGVLEASAPGREIEMDCAV